LGWAIYDRRHVDRRSGAQAVKRLVAAAVLGLWCGVAQAQGQICLTPFDWCPPDLQAPTPGQVCGCGGDVGVVVTVDADGYLADDLAGEVCYTNFDPCLVEGALIGDECECGAIPGIVGAYQ
jgi:hypothetical protein